MCPRKLFHKVLCFSILCEKTSEEEDELQKPCQKSPATLQNKKCLVVPLKTRRHPGFTYLYKHLIAQEMLTYLFDLIGEV